MPDALDPRYLQGIACFNDRLFFEAHEAWEEIWMKCRGESREFYQGLIQVAVCLHHFGRGNTRGARKLFHSSLRYLDPYRPWHLGIDLDRLLHDVRRCCADLLTADEAVRTVRLDPALVPRIHFLDTCET